jgi:ribose 5-phosphate isomerase B
MTIALGSDHAGFRMKEFLQALLEKRGVTCKDMGCYSIATVDYPDFAEAVACTVATGQVDRGIIICGTGIGSCIAANKVPGVRAALCHETLTAVASRAHNDANVLCLGERVLGDELAWRIVEAWLDTEFSGEERHKRRIAKIAQIEKTFSRTGT